MSVSCYREIFFENLYIQYAYQTDDEAVGSIVTKAIQWIEINSKDRKKCHHKKCHHSQNLPTQAKN